MEYVVVTRSLMLSGMSKKGGWSKEQLSLLGVKWPPPSGWRRRVESFLIISGDTAKEFVALKDKHIRDTPT